MATYQLSKILFQPPLTAPTTATIKYKYYLDDSWITVATGIDVDTDGTILESPAIAITGLSFDTRYTIQATNEQCGGIYEEDIFMPCVGEGCPAGYVLSPDGTYCYKVETVEAIPPPSFDTLVAKNNISYGTCGSYIYAGGFNSNGTGTSSQITPANTFWVNGGGACVDNTTIDGVLNRAGVWASSVLPNQDIGFGVCINIEESKTYYIGLGCDNYGTIKLDGVTIVQQDETAVNAQYGIIGSCFRVWSIFPIELTAGIHFIELFGHNVSGNAAIGAEIYDNTSAEIIAATSYGALNLIFSTKDYVGQDVQIGSGGWTCPNSYSLATCESPIVCKRILTTDVVEC